MIVFRFPPAFNGWIIMLLVPRRLVRSHEYMTLDNNQLFEEATLDSLFAFERIKSIGT